MTVELWRAIPEWEGVYEVSNQGRVRSLDRTVEAMGEYEVKGRILAQADNGTGYLWVNLHKNGKGKQHYVHRLVYSAFVSDIKDVINHIDKDRTNNHLSNLEDVTVQQNVEYSHARHFTFTNPDGDRVELFNLNKFCRESGLDLANMHRVHKGERQQHKGWTL